jgi:hypothetical protein
VGALTVVDAKTAVRQRAQLCDRFEDMRVEDPGPIATIDAFFCDSSGVRDVSNCGDYSRFASGQRQPE